MQIDTEQLQKVFQDAWEEPVEITYDSKKDDVEQWDSINHLNLILELEDRYQIKFTREEVESLNSVSVILTLLNNKLH